MSAPEVMEPSACTWCGIAERGHGRQYADAAGWHAWERPSQEQVLARMKARRLQLAVARAGALPVPVGPEPSERDGLRAAYITALDNAHKTHPCPALGDRKWSGCVHYDEVGRIVGVGVCHSERRADAVLAVRDAELERLRARVAELEALTPAKIQTCRVCGAGYTYGQSCSTCEFRVLMAAETGSSVEVSADKLTRLLAPTQVLREDEAAEEAGQHVEWCTGCNTDHDPNQCGYQPETGGDGRG